MIMALTEASYLYLGLCKTYGAFHSGINSNELYKMTYLHWNDWALRFIIRTKIWSDRCKLTVSPEYPFTPKHRFVMAFLQMVEPNVCHKKLASLLRCLKSIMIKRWPCADV